MNLLFGHFEHLLQFACDTHKNFTEAYFPLIYAAASSSACCTEDPKESLNVNIEGKRSADGQVLCWKRVDLLVLLNALDNRRVDKCLSCRVHLRNIESTFDEYSQSYSS